MKLLITLAVVVLAVTQILETAANPLGDDGVRGQGSVALVRAKRATCDLFSGFGVQDSLCAAHCLTKWDKGYRGGHCVNGVCVCRK